MTGVDKDLATLRESSGMLADLAEAAGCNSVDVDETRAPLIEALARVEAELSRLREQRSECEQRLDDEIVAHGATESREEAAEARCARLQQALRDACDVAVWLTGLCEIPEDSAWPDEMRPKLHAAIAVSDEALAGQPAAAEGPDTPADSQEDNT